MYLDINLIDLLKNNEYYSYFGSHGYIDAISYTKGYELIAHCYELLQNNNTLYKEDVISNLRKAINLRIKDLNTNLNFEKIQNWDLAKKNKLEMLKQLGIVKPFLIKKLLNIRNGIEYDGANPPSSIECLELIDIVWYFYKSTDSYCIIDPDEFQIEFDDKENHCIALDFDFKSHKTLNFNGRMPQNFITDKPKINTIKINNFFYKDCSKNDYKKYFKANAEISPHYYSGTLNVEDIPNYIEIVAHILTKWKF